NGGTLCIVKKKFIKKLNRIFLNNKPKKLTFLEKTRKDCTFFIGKKYQKTTSFVAQKKQKALTI
ncbi:hypothetical protein R4K56_11935, partial [Brachyspira pulli]|uniref:hypothetical protein n=1 Tax=Brachyspira pulli TaxID=310721 RepID=UPI0030077163